MAGGQKINIDGRGKYIHRNLLWNDVERLFPCFGLWRPLEASNRNQRDCGFDHILFAILVYRHLITNNKKEYN